MTRKITQTAKTKNWQDIYVNNYENLDSKQDNENKLLRRKMPKRTETENSEPCLI